MWGLRLLLTEPHLWRPHPADRGADCHVGYLRTGDQVWGFLQILSQNVPHGWFLMILFQCKLAPLKNAAFGVKFGWWTNQRDQKKVKSKWKHWSGKWILKWSIVHLSPLVLLWRSYRGEGRLWHQSQWWSVQLWYQVIKWSNCMWKRKSQTAFLKINIHWINFTSTISFSVLYPCGTPTLDGSQTK